jgi:hypothetical protein
MCIKGNDVDEEAYQNVGSMYLDDGCSGGAEQRQAGDTAVSSRGTTVALGSEHGHTSEKRVSAALSYEQAQHGGCNQGDTFFLFLFFIFLIGLRSGSLSMSASLFVSWPYQPCRWVLLSVLASIRDKFEFSAHCKKINRNIVGFLLFTRKVTVFRNSAQLSWFYANYSFEVYSRMALLIK